MPAVTSSGLVLDMQPTTEQGCIKKICRLVTQVPVMLVSKKLSDSN
jgi:hypothetical protein